MDAHLIRLKNLLSLLRISQWSKSAFVLLGFCYTPLTGYFIPALTAALAFCLISSAVYIYNDIEDRSEDRLHPHKRFRALASEQVSVFEAIVLLFLLLASGLGVGLLVSKKLVLILCLYLLVNIAYNHVFKLLPVLDVLCIAIGFLLRVLAGTIGIGLPLSPWLTIAATLLSLFIALNKRRMELHLGLKNKTRQVLKNYHPLYLDWAITLTGVAALLTYFLYVVIVRDESFYFMLTLPFAAIALWRFAAIAQSETHNDDPVLVFLHDKLSRINFWCFIVLTFMALGVNLDV